MALTKAQQVYRKRLLSIIHMNNHCKYLKSIDAWEDFLIARFDENSCKNLSISELERVKTELVGEASFTKHKPDVKGRALLYENVITSKQVKYMRELWREKSHQKDISSLLRFSSKVIGTLYVHLEIMTQEEATKIISVLERRL